MLDLGATRAQYPEWYAGVRRLPPATAQGAARQADDVAADQDRDQADSGAELRRITIPTDLLWGRHDRMVPLAIGESAHAAFGWPLHVIDDVAHAPHVERPEAFLAAISEIEAHPAI